MPKTEKQQTFSELKPHAIWHCGVSLYEDLVASQRDLIIRLSVLAHQVCKGTIINIKTVLDAF